MPNDTPNGNDNSQQRLSRLEEAHRKLEELVAANAELSLQHDEFLKAHEKRMAEIERQAEIDRQRSRETDERVDKLVSAIGEFIRRLPAPPSAP